jgi:hypothetical protein
MCKNMWFIFYVSKIFVVVHIDVLELVPHLYIYYVINFVYSSIMYKYSIL